jgi:hypothetical protein
VYVRVFLEEEGRRKILADALLMQTEAVVSRYRIFSFCFSHLSDATILE